MDKLILWHNHFYNQSASILKENVKKLFEKLQIPIAEIWEIACENRLLPLVNEVEYYGKILQALNNAKKQKMKLLVCDSQSLLAIKKVFEKYFMHSSFKEELNKKIGEVDILELEDAFVFAPEIVLQAWYPVGKGRVFYSEPLKQLSKKYNTSIMKFVIQWHKQKGFIPILGLYSETEIQEALGKIDFEISPEDMAFVDLLDGTQSSGMHTDGRYLDYIPVIPKFPRLQKATLFEPSVRTYKLFGFIPFFKIKDVNINCKQYYLFNILICRCQQKMIIPNKTNWTREEKLSGKYVIEPIFNIQNEFLECPVFDEKNNVLYCVASKNNKIYKIDLTTKEYETIPTLGGIVGSIALNKDGTLLCAEESGIYKLDLKNNERIFLADFKNKDRVYNDGKLDAKGRFIVGTSGKFNNGKLYSFDGKQVKVLEENITCSNGIAFSKDNKTMYYIDSESHKVAKYKYNLETGEAIFDKYVIEIEAGTPDGMCIDEDENLWIAEYDGCKISKYETKNYTKIDEIIMPVYPTSVCLAKGSNPHPERTSDRGGGLLYCTTTKAKNSNKYSGLFVIRYK